LRTAGCGLLLGWLRPHSESADHYAAAPRGGVEAIDGVEVKGPIGSA